MPDISNKSFARGAGITACAAAGIAVVAFAIAPAAFATSDVEKPDYSFHSASILQNGTSSSLLLNDLEGISSPETYWALLSKERDANKGIAESAFTELDGYLDDIQKEELSKAETAILAQDSFQEIRDGRAAFESMLEEPRQQKQSDIEAEEAAYQEYLASLESQGGSYSGNGDYDMQGGDGVLTKSGGVNEFNGRHETWYSQRVLPGDGLDIPGRHVAEDGTIRDEDGYIAVAASDLPRGSVVETSLGTGKVYDSGCAAGTTDIYTDW